METWGKRWWWVEYVIPIGGIHPVMFSLDIYPKEVYVTGSLPFSKTYHFQELKPFLPPGLCFWLHKLLQFEDSNWQKLLAENFLEVVGQRWSLKLFWKVFDFTSMVLRKNGILSSNPSEFLTGPLVERLASYQESLWQSASFWLVNDHGFTSRWHEMNNMNISCLPLRKFQIDVQKCNFSKDIYIFQSSIFGIYLKFPGCMVYDNDYRKIVFFDIINHIVSTTWFIESFWVPSWG